MRHILENKRLIIFDLDDTLVYTPREVLIRRLETVLDKAGLPQKEEAEIRHFYDSHDWDNVLRNWGFDHDEFNLFLETYIDYVENQEKDPAIIFPDSISCLAGLKENGMKISLITSATPKYAQAQIEKIGSRYFDFWACAGAHADIKSKPDPHGVIASLSCLGGSLQNTAVIGDSYLDIGMARNAGCLDILISRNNLKPSIKSTLTIKSLLELI
jgi:phosphoglycolate phosphatase-like HAD superfamily hydrolase